MMNLLAHSEKAVVRREHLWRFLEVCGFTVIALSLFAFVMLLPSFIYIQFESGVAEDALKSALAERQILEKDTATQSLVKEVQDQLAILKPEETPELELASVVDALLARRTPGVAITSISFGRGVAGVSSRGQLDIVGTASTRALFLNFVASVETEETFGRVDSPITNLVKDKDLNFVIHVDVK